LGKENSKQTSAVIKIKLNKAVASWFHGTNAPAGTIDSLKLSHAYLAKTRA
jgi:hypothetical protein